MRNGREHKSIKKSKDWILEKKERRRRQGKYVVVLFILNEYIHIYIYTCILNECIFVLEAYNCY